MKFLVLLADGTVGVAHSIYAPKVGDLYTIDLLDENGWPIQKTGLIAEILDEIDED